MRLAALALGAAGIVVAALLLARGDEDGDGTPRLQRTANGPNVVLIQADDQALESMRVMRRTHRLIGERGVTFERHFANWPLCCPARATQLTGQYAHNHGVLGNKPPNGSYATYPRESNLATWLAEAGYEVGHVGKFLNGYGIHDDEREPVGDRVEIPPGWTDWRTGTGGDGFSYYEYTVNEWSDDGGERAGTLIEHGGAVRDYKSDVDTRAALELIERYAGEATPFYLQVDYPAPHPGGPKALPQPPGDCDGTGKPAPRHARAFDDEPLATRRDGSFNEADVTDKPGPVAGREPLNPRDVAEIARMYRCELESLLALDEGVAAIVKRLRSTGELRDTYVIYTSDNGSFHGEHRLPSGKNEVYEPAIRVPLLIRGPKLPPGLTVRELTTNADLAPTILAITGADPPGDWRPDGLSLLQSIRHPREERGRELLIETNRFAAVRTGRYKWVENDDGFTELYDLARDPFEELNVAPEPAYREAAEALAARLVSLRDCTGQDCRLTPALEVVHERDCTRGEARVALTGADIHRVVSLSVRARGVVATDHSAPFDLRLRYSASPGGDRATVARATLTDGRRVTRARHLRACR